MKFYVRRLGCPKNDVDADYITARLVAEGHQPVDRPEDAESVIVNTCGFILPAKEESISEIFELSRLKQNGSVKYLYASGCLSQRYGPDLAKEIPELDGVFGVGELDAICNSMRNAKGDAGVFRTGAERMRYIAGNSRFISDDLPYAYIKISDGCDRTCSFCAIPSIRGHYRSRPIESILNEARFLVEKGKKELILVSQESTLYGCDLKKGIGLLDLLKELDAVEGIHWIRLLYLYPSQVSEALIDYMGSPDNKTLNYFDIPLQHINNDVLDAMGRHTSRAQIEILLKDIRYKNPGAAIRTAFIVGFPGETEKHFEELREFVADFQFDRMGVFSYSAEEGTPAEGLGGQVDEQTKQDRLDELMSVQSEIAFEKNKTLIGNIKDVIIDAVSEGRAVGRTASDCPEIDQEVYVTGGAVRPGEIVAVRIDAADGYDLIGTIVKG